MVLNNGALVTDWSKMEKRLAQLLDVNMNKIKMINYFTYLAKNQNTNYKISQIQFANIKQYFSRILDILYDDVDYSTASKFIYLTQYFCYEKLVKPEPEEEEEPENPFDQSLCIDKAQKKQAATPTKDDDIIAEPENPDPESPQSFGETEQVEENNLEEDESLAMSQAINPPVQGSPEKMMQDIQSNTVIVFMHEFYFKYKLATDEDFWNVSLKEMYRVSSPFNVKQS